MRPAARLQTLSELLAETLSSRKAADFIVKQWGRQNRFAGSKDRAAIRDYVFDVLRTRRSCAWHGRSAMGRGLMIGLLRGQGIDPSTLFTGEGHAPALLVDYEIDLPEGEMPAADAAGIPR